MVTNMASYTLAMICIHLTKILSARRLWDFIKNDVAYSKKGAANIWTADPQISRTITTHKHEINTHTHVTFQTKNASNHPSILCHQTKNKARLTNDKSSAVYVDLFKINDKLLGIKLTNPREKTHKSLGAPSCYKVVGLENWDPSWWSQKLLFNRIAGWKSWWKIKGFFVYKLVTISDWFSNKIWGDS